MLRRRGIVKDDAKVANAHRVALKESWQIPCAQIELNTEIFCRVAFFSAKFRKLLVGTNMIGSLLFLEDLEHRHVLLDEAGILSTQLSDHEKSLAAVRQKLDYVENKHSISPYQKWQHLRSWLSLHWLRSLQSRSSGLNQLALRFYHFAEDLLILNVS